MNEKSILDAVLLGLWRVVKFSCIGLAVALTVCCALTKNR